MIGILPGNQSIPCSGQTLQSSNHRADNKFQGLSKSQTNCPILKRLLDLDKLVMVSQHAMVKVPCALCQSEVKQSVLAGQAGGQESDCGDAIHLDSELGSRGAEVAGCRALQGSRHAARRWC